MSLEMELWAMNSARISALEAGGGGGGSTSDLCVKIPKFDWPYAYEHSDEMVQYEFEEEDPFGNFYIEFTVPDDGKPYYAVLGNNVGWGVRGIVTVIESSGGELLDGDFVHLSEIVYDEEGNADLMDAFTNSIWSNHQTILYDPELEGEATKSYSIAYDDRTFNYPIRLKNGVTYQASYEFGFSPDIDDTESKEALENMREFIAESTFVVVVPGTYEEVPVAVRNGGNT